MNQEDSRRLVRIEAGKDSIEGILHLPAEPRGMVLFAHGSGSGRHSPRNNFVAGELRSAGFGTLLADLLTPEEDRDYAQRFDIDLLATRLADCVGFVDGDSATAGLPVGLFGASTGAAAALRLAAAEPERVAAVVSRGGRPDLAGPDALAAVRAPTLLIVGGRDDGVIELNEAAHGLLTCTKHLSIVPGATHLFEEPGTLEKVAELAADWFRRHLAAGANLPSGA